MKKIIELEQEDYDYLNDMLVYAFKLKINNNTEILKYFNLLPDDIKEIAYRWGFSDSVFRDDAYIWFKENEEVLFKENEGVLIEKITRN